MGTTGNRADRLRHLFSRHSLLAALATASLVLSACTAGNYAPVVDVYGASGKRTPVTRGVHVVRPGETLYSIAWRYGWDFRSLARANSIGAPYTIYPGQKIRLDGAVRARAPSTASSTTQRSSSSTASSSSSSTASTSPSSTSTTGATSSSASASGPVAWQWPATGKVLSSFSRNTVGRQGILIAGETGDPVRAAADGTVVYRGDGLTGYGNLLIVKHSELWLSAYAHNERMLVKEGARVKAGEKIATMGATGTFRTQLHFEIRKSGTPVNPVALLPGR